MTCEFKYGEDGQVIAIVCSSAFGLGVTQLYGQEAEDFGSCIYGNFRGGNPNDFTPDEECSTEEERAAWREACIAWGAEAAKGAK